MVRSGGGQGRANRTVPFLCLQKGHFETSISATQRIAVPPPTPALALAYRLHLFLPLTLLHVCSFRFHNTGLGKSKKNQAHIPNYLGITSPLLHHQVT